MQSLGQRGTVTRINVFRGLKTYQKRLLGICYVRFTLNTEIQRDARLVSRMQNAYSAIQWPVFLK